MPIHPTIKNIIFDLGGVILEIEWRQTFEILGLTDPATQTKFIDQLSEWETFHQFERGKVSAGDFFLGINQMLGTRHGPEILTKAWNRIIVRELPGVAEIFQRYSGRVPIYALSNTNTVHFDYVVAEYPILAKFDRLFTSFEMGERKPDAEIFWAAAKLAGIDPSRAIFIDDLASNVAAAKRVGYHAYQTVNSPQETLKMINQHF